MTVSVAELRWWGHRALREGKRLLGRCMLSFEPLLDRIGHAGFVALHAHYSVPDPSSPAAHALWKGLSYLNSHTNLLPLEEALGRWSRNDRFPPRSVVLIIDDASADFAAHAWPRLETRGMPFTLAVVSGLVPDGAAHHLQARLMRFLHEDRGELIPERVRLLPEKYRGKSQDELFNLVLRLDVPELADLLGELNPPESGLATWEALERIQKSPLAALASHTMSHPMLRFVRGDWLAWECGQSRTILRERLGCASDVFVYPYGGLQQCHNGEVLGTLRRCGYRYGFLTEPGAITGRRHPYLLPRMFAEVDEAALRIHTNPKVCSTLHSAPRM